MRAEAEAAAAAGAGTEIAGYKRLQKTQMQVNGIRVLPRMLGSTQSVLVGEVAYQRANVGDRNTGKRFGRSFIFGFAPHASYLADSQDASLGAAVQQVAGESEQGMPQRMRKRMADRMMDSQPRTLGVTVFDSNSSTRKCLEPPQRCSQLSPCP